MNNKLLSFFLLIFFFALSSSPVSAHFLATNGNIGAILHMDPNDSPVANEQTLFMFQMKDKTNTVTPQNCDCLFTISENGKVINTQPLFQKNQNVGLTATRTYTFTQKDIYQIEVLGKPIQKNTFKPFVLTWNVRVDQEVAPQNNATNVILMKNIPSLISIAILVILFLLYLRGSKKKLMKSTNKKQLTIKSVLPYLLVIGGIIGFIMAFIIMVEKLTLLTNPDYHPPCSINPVISCGSVMKTAQSSAFGFPNPLIGLAGFAIVITVGMALFAQATFKRWFWLGLEAGTLFGVLFIHWLFYQSVYVIGALCPFCMVVWTVTIPIFLYTTIYNIREGHLKAPSFIKKFLNYHTSILFLWYLLIIGAILIRFWYYWKTII